MNKIEEYVRSIPDFPEKGIIFRDITSVLQDADGLHLAIDSMQKLLEEEEYTRENKARSGIYSAVSTCYWLLVTAVFLFVCFGPYGNAKPQYYWVIWAIAGVLYGAVTAVLKAVRRQ